MRFNRGPRELKTRVSQFLLKTRVQKFIIEASHSSLAPIKIIIHFFQKKFSMFIFYVNVIKFGLNFLSF